MASPTTLTPATLEAADRDGELVKTTACHTRVLIESLPVNAQAAVLLALTTPSVKTSDITRVLTSHGLPAKTENVARHRRRLTGGSYACKCPRPIEAAK